MREMPHILPKGQEGVAALAIAAFEHGNQGSISNLLTAEKMRAVLDFADTDMGKSVINAYTGPEGGMNMRKADLDIRSGNGNQYFHEDGSTVMRNSSDLTRRY